MNTSSTIISETFFKRFHTVFEPYLNIAGVDPSVLTSSDVEIPEFSYIELWDVVSRDNPNVGLEVGSCIEIDNIGALGYAIYSSQTMKMALEILSKFIVVFSQQSRIDFSITGTKIVISYSIEDPTFLYHKQDSEFSISAILKILNLITGDNVLPERVDFKHRKPEDTSFHKDIFRCPIYFNQEENRLYFSSVILSLPIICRNERLFVALEPYLEQQRKKRISTDNLLLRIKSVICSDLNLGPPSLLLVSKQLGMSVRTLQRKLSFLGVDFSVLVENVRRDLAVEYLINTAKSITEISLSLGYSESGSFSRAFRRWTGYSPLQYRNKCIKD